MTLRRVVVCLGSSPQIPSAVLNEAHRLGKLIAARQIEAVFGASNSGAMAAFADGVAGCGGTLIGVGVAAVGRRHEWHPAADYIFPAADIPDSLRRMLTLAEGFIFLPGGVGTLTELATVLQARMLSETQAPVVIVNVEGLLDDIVGWLGDGPRIGLSRRNPLAGVHVVSSAQAAIDAFDEVLAAPLTQVS